MNETTSRILQEQITWLCNLTKILQRHVQIHLCSTNGMQDISNHCQFWRSSKEPERHRDESKSHTLSPADAVSRERVAAPRAVTRPAAVVSEAPVSQHTPVAKWPCHPRLARAVTIARVTEGQWAKGKDSWSNWMTGTHCNRRGHTITNELLDYLRRLDLAIPKWFPFRYQNL